MKDIGQLTAGDKLAMRGAVRLPLGGDAERPTTVFSFGDMDFQIYVVAARVIMAWSYPYTLPKQDPSRDEHDSPAYEESLKLLPIDDWNELEGALVPYKAKLDQDPKAARTTSTTSRHSSKAKAAASPITSAN
jgi:hypothetical protein